jgi:AcrR family transcriptional regulator
VTSLSPVSQTPAPRSGDRRVRRRIQRRDAILAMTAKVIAERGYTNTNLEEIADRLDLAKPSLYHYFDSKESLVYETLKACALAVSTSLQQIADRDDPPVVRLRELISFQIRMITVEAPEACRLFLYPIDWPASLSEAVGAWRAQHDDIFRRVIKEGIDAGELQVADAGVSRLCLQGALGFIPQWLHLQPPPNSAMEPADAEAHARDVVTDTLMRLFLA